MRRLLIPLLLSLLPACASNTKASNLQDTLRTYEATMRWGDWAQAQVLMDPDVLKEHPLTQLDLERIRQFRVSYYHQGDAIASKAGEVQVVAEIGLINVNTQSERTVVDRETWRYNEKTKRWLLISGLPDLVPH